MHLCLSLLVATSALIGVQAQTPLVDKHFSYPDGIPYQADPDDGVRGTQQGYNICNSTTQNQQSLCQTSFLNSIDDFCLWGAPNPNSTVGDVEGEMVAWCTQPNHGSRVIPGGTLKGVQFMKTPDYVQVVGFIDQTKVNLQDGDFGGEMDPHGADLRGNPLGGLMYSNAFGTNKNQYTQVIEWHNFIGSNFFCLKACDPAGPNAKHFCEHIYDRIGCAYNAPNNAQEGVFEACQGDDQDYPGVYVTNGVTVTYQQPPESLGPITSIPYTARVPASSNCVTYTSSVIYAAEATISGAVPTSSSVSSTSTSRSGTSTAPTPSPTGNAAQAVKVSAAMLFWGAALSSMLMF